MLSRPRRVNALAWQRTLSVALALCFVLPIKAQSSSDKKESTAKKTPAKKGLK